MYKFILLLIFIASLYAIEVYAKTPSDPTCLLLGPTPSFIIKFHHSPPALLAHEQLALKHLRDIAVPGIIFTHTKHMRREYYIAHVQFKEESNLQIPTNAQGSNCYSPDFRINS